MAEPPALDPTADAPKLLAQVVGYYHTCLKNSPDALGYLAKRGITHPRAVDHFRVGFSDRSLGLHLPTMDSRAGVAIRTRLREVGLYRASGHEHLRGSLTFPIPAATGTGEIVDVYARKTQGEVLRRGTPLHLHLGEQRCGVWNVEAFAGASEVVVTTGLFDALTFWSHGFRNVTCLFGRAVYPDLLAAVAEFGVRRVLTTSEPATESLLAAGLETFLVRLPIGLDVNAYALKSSDPADALGNLLRHAEWVGKGTPVVTPAIPRTREEDDAPEQDRDMEVGGEIGGELPPVPTAWVEDDEDDEVIADQDEGDDQPAEPPPVEPPVRTASPLPLAPAPDEAVVNGNELVMTFGNRRYRVRGLDAITPEQLRVNVLVSSSVGLHADTLDLYQSKARTLFQTQAAGELRVEEAVIKKDLGRLLLKLEEVQEAKTRSTSKAHAPPVPEMTAGEQADAFDLLRDPHLLDRIAGDFIVVGDRSAKVVGYLAAVSRKLDTPLAVVIQSSSAAGKTTLMDAILQFAPPEDVVQFSAMTGQSLYYLPPDSLRHKVLAVAEEAGASRASYALKLLQSEGAVKIASTGKDAGTGRLVATEYKVEGPTALFLTTTSINPDEELLNRCMVLSVDEGREQTRAVHALQRKKQTLDGLVAAKRLEAVVNVHRNAQRLLRPLLVVNPFAERLTFPDTSARTRRDHAKYLTLIRAVTLLHQHQRPVRTAEVNGQTVEFIEVTIDDIAAANDLAHAVLGQSLDDLPPQTRTLLTSLDAHVTEACEAEGIDREDFRFTRRDVRTWTGWSYTQVAVHMQRLERMEYLHVRRERGTGRTVYALVGGSLNGERRMPGLTDVAVLRGQKPGYDAGAAGGVGAVSGRCRGGIGGVSETPPQGYDGANPPPPPSPDGASDGCGWADPWLAVASRRRGGFTRSPRKRRALPAAT